MCSKLDRKPLQAVVPKKITLSARSEKHARIRSPDIFLIVFDHSVLPLHRSLKVAALQWCRITHFDRNKIDTCCSLPKQTKARMSIGWRFSRLKRQKEAITFINNSELLPSVHVTLMNQNKINNKLGMKRLPRLWVQLA